MTRFSMGKRFMLTNGIVVMDDQDGDVTVFDSHRGRYWRGNVGAKDILQILHNPVTPAEIIDIMCERYDTDRDAVSNDVSATLSQLQAARLVKKVRQ